VYALDENRLLEKEALAMAKESWEKWLRTCLRDPANPARIALFGDGLPSLGALTGQDKRVLDAISACWKLYSSSNESGESAAFQAIRSLLRALQPQCRPFARELIAFSLDWPDCARLWPLVQPGREDEG
jgi:hypothetical protein